MAPHVYSVEIGKFVKKHRKRIIFSPIPLQSEQSETCGQHTMVFLYLRAIGTSRKRIFNLYNQVHLETNDQIVLNLYQKIFGVK